MNSVIDKDFLLDLRRNAYIECTENYLENNNVVGIFGDNIPEDIFYACKLLPVPIEGVDSHIFKFGKENEGTGYCDVIKSSLIYLTTQKCPILYSCKMYVIEDKCQAFYKVMSSNTEKEIYIYKNEKELIQVLYKIYGTHYDENLRQQAKRDLDYINQIIQKIEFYSDIDTETVFLFKYYTKYILNLHDRKKYFTSINDKINFKKEKKLIKKITALCPRGNFKNICNNVNSSSVRLERNWDNSDYGYTNCIYNFLKEENYQINL